MPRGDQWICPNCERPFGRAGQSHNCMPTMSADEYFADREPEDREIFVEVAAALTACGPVEVEFVSVGVLFKTTRTIVELRPRRRGMAVSILLPEEINSPRVTRRANVGRRGGAVSITLQSPDDVDDELIEWLQDAFDAAEP